MIKTLIFLGGVYLAICYFSQKPEKKNPIKLDGYEPTKADILEEISFIIEKDVTGSLLAVKKNTLAQLLEKLK